MPGGGKNVPIPDGKKVLERMAKMTGGRMFEASRKGSLEEILKEIREEVAGAYTLTFTPDKRGAEEGYHRIVLGRGGGGGECEGRVAAASGRVLRGDGVRKAGVGVRKGSGKW